MLTLEEKKERKRLSNKYHFSKWYSKGENKVKNKLRGEKWLTSEKGKKWKETHYHKKLLPDAERFFEKVSKDGNGCWIWTGSRTPLKYGRFLKGYAHRFSYKLHKGEIPDGMSVCHTCDNPPCVNPSHLWIGTQKENIADRDRKGRGRRKT